MRAGDVLAGIGDPILNTVRTVENFISVPGGLVQVGRELPATAISRKGQRLHWSPTRQVPIRGFRVAKYPVTNLEFLKFIDAGGYQRPELWLADSGRLWLQQDSAFLSLSRDVVIESLGVHYNLDVEGDFMNLLDHSNLVEEFCEGLLCRSRPMYWTDGRFNQPNQPVVGVNWWEASAYCTWLTEVLLGSGQLSTGEECRLLKEEEWEYCAGGGTGQAFPWGQIWSDEMAHVRTASDWITRSVAIGAYPWATSVFGVECLVGNIWEWCGSQAQEPCGVFSDTGPIVDRATRGSSWLARELLTRDIAFRSYDPPCNAYVDVGFRVASAKGD